MIKSARGKVVTLGLSGALMWGFATLTSAADSQVSAAMAEVTAPRVYQEVEIFRDEVERIRQYLGVRAPRERSYKLSKAQPRQTFYIIANAIS